MVGLFKKRGILKNKTSKFRLYDKEKQAPTKIIFGFETHFPSFPRLQKKLMKKADVLLVEVEPRYINELRKSTPKQVASKFEDKGYTQELFSLLKKQMKKGKIVIGTDLQSDKAKRKFKEAELEVKRPPMLDMLSPEKIDPFDHELKAAKLLSEHNTIREQDRLKWILDNIDKFRGKTIYIHAGAGHTPIYYSLKKALANEEAEGKTSIKKENFSRSYYDKPIVDVFLPSDQAMKLIMFKKGKLTPSDEKRIRLLLRDQEEFMIKWDRLTLCKRDEGNTPEIARKKAYYELSQKMWKEHQRKIIEKGLK